MTKRAALAFLAAAPPLMLLAFVSGSPRADGVFAVLAAAFPVALVALGAERRGGASRLLAPLVGLLVVFEWAVVAMLSLRGQVLSSPWVLGLPLAAAVEVYVLFFLPLVAVGLLYAWSFEETAFSRRDLDLLRRRRG